MIKRIKYIKGLDGNFISQEIIKTVDRIELRAGYVGGDPKTPTVGFIKSVGSDTINIQIPASSHWKIKIKLKKALQKLGCIFSTEKRQHRK